MADTDIDVIDEWSRQFGMRPAVAKTKWLMEILAGTPNPHKHRHKDLQALEGSVGAVGFKNVIMLWMNPETKKPEVIYGGGRIMAGDKAGFEDLPIVWALDFDLAKAKLLRLADNRVQHLAPAYDDALIIDHLKDIKFADLDFGFLKYDRYLPQLVDDIVADDPIFEDLAPGYAEEVNGPVSKVVDEVAARPMQPPKPHVEAEGDTEPEWVPPDIELENASFPSDNDMEVPLLSLKLQATNVIEPVVKWGEISRKTKMQGTWHFYVEDSKFEPSLWKDPRGPLYSGAQAIVEANYSAGANMPRGWVVGQTWKKRWMSRWWQSKGLRVFVDMNVARKHYDINMLGVPYGWLAYATRGYNDLLDAADAQFEVACERAETDDILFVVYGGGKKIQDHSLKRGWHWVPERMDVVWNKHKSDGLATKVDLDEFKDIKK